MTTATSMAAGALRLLGTHHRPTRHHHPSGAHKQPGQTVISNLHNTTSTWPFAHLLGGPAGPVLFISAISFLVLMYLLTRHPVIFGGITAGVLLIAMGVSPEWAKTQPTGRVIAIVFAVLVGVGGWWVSSKIHKRLKARAAARAEAKKAAKQGGGAPQGGARNLGGRLFGRGAGGAGAQPTAPEAAVYAAPGGPYDDGM